MASELVPSIGPSCVRSQQALHPGEQVEMIGPEAKGVDRPARRPPGFLQDGQEPLAIRVVVEEGRARIPATHERYIAPRIITAKAARHARESGKSTLAVNNRA